jgi:hypothetical protein
MPDDTPSLDATAPPAVAAWLRRIMDGRRRLLEMAKDPSPLERQAALAGMSDALSEAIAEVELLSATVQELSERLRRQAAELRREGRAIRRRDDPGQPQGG